MKHIGPLSSNESLVSSQQIEYDMKFTNYMCAVPIFVSSLFISSCDEAKPDLPIESVEASVLDEPEVVDENLDEETEQEFAPDKTPEQIQERLDFQRNMALGTPMSFKIFPQLTKLDSNTIPLAHQQILYAILQNTNEVAIHQMRGESENTVYVNDNGQEAVYDKDGNLIQNGYNDGTYNYAHHEHEPLLHFLLDISPWILWGLNESDPTTMQERIYAYMGDLEGGIRRANASLPMDPLPEDHKWTELGQLQALALFVKAIELGEAEEIYELFEEGYTVTDEELIRVLTKLNVGFDKLYKIPGN